MQMNYALYSWNAVYSLLAGSDHNRPSIMCLTLFLQKHKVSQKFVLGLVMLITLEHYIKMN